jgi:hypothetical protein
VTAALEARLPGVTARAGETAGRRLELAPADDAIAVLMRDGAGAIELERSLPVDRGVATAGRPVEACQALAEAAALIVVRYLQEIGYRPPPPVAEAPVVATSAGPAPPVPHRSAGLLGAGAAGRVGLGGSGPVRGEVTVELGALFGPVALALAGGASSETAVDVPRTGGQGQLRLRAYPVRLGLGVPFALGPGALIPTAGLSLDLLSFRASGLADARQGLRVEPAAELGGSYLLLGRRLFARGSLVGGWTLAPRDFSAGTEPVFRTPDAYLRATVELGAVLWKNWGDRAL